MLAKANSKRRLSRSRPHPFHENKLLNLELPSWRARFTNAMLLLCFCVLIGRAFYLQVINTGFLQGKGEARYLRDIETTATRGRIFDRNGDILAVSTPTQDVWASTAQAKSIANPQMLRLAQALEMDPRVLRKKLARKNPAVKLQSRVSLDQADKVAALNLPGIYQEHGYQRHYPTGSESAHVVGFTGYDDKGLEGLELAFQKGLQATTGSRTVIKNRRGQIVEETVRETQAQQGADVHLAIDVRIQHQAYLQLQKAITANKAKAGSVIVLDSKSGEILALVNLPGFNPNERKSITAQGLRNRAVTDQFEPGSTLKPFSVALALEQVPKLKPSTVFHIGNGKYVIQGKTISDAHSKRSDLSVQQIIKYSSNIGMAKMTEPIPPQKMWTMFDQLGFGRDLKIGYPGEANGKLRPWKEWQPVEKATMSYGHGIAVTLLQLAHAYLPLARNGETIPLSILHQGQNTPASVGTQVFKPETVAAIRTMLEMAVSDDGTAPKARVAGYRVGGKTGTAYKIENGKYVKKYVSSFVGIAPISDPRLVIAVMLDEPAQASHYGGDAAGPAFSAIAGSALRMLAVPRDGDNTVVAQENTARSKPRSDHAGPL